jgi:hypothetical protein
MNRLAELKKRLEASFTDASFQLVAAEDALGYSREFESITVTDSIVDAIFAHENCCNLNWQITKKVQLMLDESHYLWETNSYSTTIRWDKASIEKATANVVASVSAKGTGEVENTESAEGVEDATLHLPLTTF